jgi:hypothetical protein
MAKVTTKARRPFFPENRNGIAIDAVLIIATLFIYPFLMSRIGNLFDLSFQDDPQAFKTPALLMVFILAGRLIGLYLKRFSLQSRHEKSADARVPMYFFIFNVPVLVLTAAFVSVLGLSVIGELGIGEPSYFGPPKPLEIFNYLVPFGMLMLICVEIVFLFRLGRPLNKREKELRDAGSWMFDWRGETAADFGLFAYMMIWQVFYNNTITLLMTPPPNAGPITLDLKIVGTIFMFVVFCMFYLSPRTVFLIEDGKYRGTWLFILLVFAASIMRNLRIG